MAGDFLKQKNIYEEILANLPDRFSTDYTCSMWPDKWNGVVYKSACLLHDYLYNEARIHPKYYKLGKKRSDKILAYGVARLFRMQGKRTGMATVMKLGLGALGWYAWWKNGRKMKKKYPGLWEKYQGN